MELLGTLEGVGELGTKLTISAAFLGFLIGYLKYFVNSYFPTLNKSSVQIIRVLGFTMFLLITTMVTVWWIAIFVYVF